MFSVIALTISSSGTNKEYCSTSSLFQFASLSCISFIPTGSIFKSFSLLCTAGFQNTFFGFLCTSSPYQASFTALPNTILPPFSACSTSLVTAFSCIGVKSLTLFFWTTRFFVVFSTSFFSSAIVHSTFFTREDAGFFVVFCVDFCIFSKDYFMDLAADRSFDISLGKYRLIYFCSISFVFLFILGFPTAIATQT